MVTSLPVLTFHALDERSSVISFSPQVFQHGISKLHGKGYKTLGLTEALGFLHRRTPFPDRSFVITFDDGYQSVYQEAFPVLQRYGMTATVFITTGRRKTIEAGERLSSLQGRFMLSWHEIREMHRSGIAFGAHTVTHPDLTRLSFNDAKAEICRSKAILEDALGASVLSFAYPYGRFNSETRSIVQQHFGCACSDKLGHTSKASDVYALERVDAYYLRTDRLFNLMFARLFPWYIRALSIRRRIRRAFSLSPG
jgi:peptidoglycan/xylan/chitin deacetylase (PgdA/CDA1 family)